MSEWRYIATRLNGDGTEDILTEVPLEEVGLTSVVSGPAGHTSSVSPAMLRILADDGRPLFDPWSTALYAEQDGVIRNGCILTDRQIAGPQMSLTGAGFTAAIKGQPYAASKFFIKTDPIDIARHIWDHWQTQDGGNLGLQLDRKTKAGTLIGTELRQAEFDTVNGPVSFESGPYKLTDYLTDDLGGAIDKLATDYHFDYAERHAWNADRTAIEHFLDFGAPRIGRRRDDLRFVAGENMLVSPDESDASDQYASAVLVRGAGDGPAMKRKLVVRGGERRLRRVRVVTDNTIRTDAGLLKRGASDLSLLAGSNEVTSIAVIDSRHTPIGSWRDGDEILVQTSSEWGSDNIWVRVLSTSLSPDNLGMAILSVVRADKIPS